MSVLPRSGLCMTIRTRAEVENLPPYGNGTLPAGIRSRLVDHVNGMTVHMLEAGSPDQPALLLLHGFPELAYSWRNVMLPLAARGLSRHCAGPARLRPHHRLG